MQERPIETFVGPKMKIIYQRIVPDLLLQKAERVNIYGVGKTQEYYFTHVVIHSLKVLLLMVKPSGREG